MFRQFYVREKYWQNGVRIKWVLSAERGEMFTVAIAVNTQGNSTPPMFLLPHKAI